MKTLIATTLILLTTQAVQAHPDCVFHNAPVGSSNGKYTTKSQKKADSILVNTTIQVKEKLDELVSLFNVFSPRKIQVLAALSQGSSIDRPLKYSAQTIVNELNELQRTMNPELRNVLFNNGKPNLSKISEADIRQYGSRIAGLYEMAIRYDLLIQRKSAYVQASIKDVRGFYYLFSRGIDDKKLVNFNQYSVKDQNDIQAALIGICRNSNIKTSNCTRELKNSVRSNNVAAFYSKYRNRAVENWNTFFQIPQSAKRNDVSIRNNVLKIPFKMQKSKLMHDFVQSIEDQWKVSGLAVHLDLQDKKNIPNLILKENSVAHVNELGGNDITMNSTLDFTQANTKRTLSHEFGHVLGLPDCYIEFYDEDEQVFVNYQLFKDDMMCSAGGKLTPRIVNELKRVYGNN